MVYICPVFAILSILGSLQEVSFYLIFFFVFIIISDNWLYLEAIFLQEADFFLSFLKSHILYTVMIREQTSRIEI